MSRMMLRSNGKPPLARSPIRLRPRRKALQPTNNNTILTPPGSMAKSQLPIYNRAVENSILRPEYHTISYELQALAKMVHQELGPGDDTSMVDVGGIQRSPLFERGRFYDEYSARRNERLKRKKGSETAYEKKPSYDLGVRVEPAKKRVESANKFDGRRKSMVVAVAATPVAERREARTPRYSLRSSAAAKENKKPPPMPVAVVPMMSGERSVGVSERKMGVKRVISRRV
ncbi:hypothetical protein PHJA_001998600 [Phtheirospermum japonicum]|uniref:Uncharacterized protein n=1 Tax=Phtheirospermum japonicum TaxID=374723 RepID=A0A830CCR4_9LAMI|nr:hypothetical protein PHJA_001998600 [Phtheirospermum japonicum]